MRVLVTGAAGFIGYHVCRQLLARGVEVLGVDNLNPYYDPGLKQGRLKELLPNKAFKFMLMDISDSSTTAGLIDSGPLYVTVHLAAQAGVRYSQEAPRSYVASNIAGLLNVLEA